MLCNKSFKISKKFINTKDGQWTQVPEFWISQKSVKNWARYRRNTFFYYISHFAYEVKNVRDTPDDFFC